MFSEEDFPEIGQLGTNLTRADSFHIGNTVFGKLKLVRVLGEGATGKVYAALDLRTPEPHRAVALKVLSKKAAKDRDLVEKFRNEIHASYRISHSNVVRGTEFYRGADCLAFTMELVPGGGLDRKVKEGNIPIAEIVRITSEILIGLQAVHEAGLVHQDLKPANILCDFQGKIKITDFTTAKLAANLEPSQDGGITGTWEYISPEGLSDGIISTRSDIYALGTIIYELITGEVPFKGANSFHEAELKLYTSAMPPHLLRPDCPFALSRFTMTALERKPEKRFKTAEQMRYVLENLDFDRQPTALDNLKQKFTLWWEGINRKASENKALEAQSEQGGRKPKIS